MPKVRRPRALAELTGAVRRNPQRYRPEVATQPLGDPPAHLAAGELAAWHELVAADRAGCIRAPDRVLLEITAVLLARYRTTDDFPVTLLRVLRQCLARLGL